jgi:hypothetical protein
MAVLITWKVSESRFVFGESAYRVYEVTGVDNELAALSACQYQQGTSHPSDSRIIARIPEVTTLAGKTLYRVAVTWYRPKALSSTPTNLGTRLRPRWTTGNASEQVDIDAFGYPIVNSAGDRCEPSPTLTITTLHLKIFQWESTFDPIKAMTYQNYVNDNAFVIKDEKLRNVGTVEPGQVLCESISEAQYDEKNDLVLVEYSFELRKEGFDYRILDAGYNGWWQDGAVRSSGKFCNSKGELHSGAVRLDGTGKPMEKEMKVRSTGAKAETPMSWLFAGSDIVLWPRKKDGAFFLRYFKYPSISFAGLDL